MELRLIGVEEINHTIRRKSIADQGTPKIKG